MEPTTQPSAARPGFQGGIGSASVSKPAPTLTKTTAAPTTKPAPTAPAAAAKPAAKATPAAAKVKAKPISKAVREAEGLVKAAQAVLVAAREHQLSEERLAKAKENYKNLAKG